MRMLWLDPGGTTGWALYQGGPFALMDHPERGIKLGQIGPHEHHLELKVHIETEISRDFLLGYESFQYRQDQDRTTVSLVSCEYIGVVKLIKDERPDLAIASQTPGEGVGGFFGKKQGGDEKIKKLGLWWPGHKHAMDALRHMLYYEVFTNGNKQILQALR